MTEKINETVEETTTEEASNSEATQVNNSENDNNKIEPYKTFNTQEDFDKFMKSESMKRVNELYKELGVNSKDELKAYKNSFEELNNLKASYDDVNTSKTALEEQLETLKKDNKNLQNELILNQFNINRENAEDFMVLAQSKVSDSKDLLAACEEVVQQYPYFKNNTVKEIFKIGSPKSEEVKRDLTADEKNTLRKFFGLN